ncbi:MAG: GIY-YIG nuclease family protein [Scytolyngbya sp. HA4215-MV1]|jgi:excinuclease UvrABC nuclease subunit|nr:GIY-YIG nuclease family protein [Scytolyngbya sp. HA4215-MV1]
MNKRGHNLSNFPWLPLELKQFFPAVPAIYFCVDEDDCIQYIGQTRNLKQRFSCHHRLTELENLVDARVYFRFFKQEDTRLLIPYEKVFIREFQPQMNRNLRSGVKRHRTPDRTKRRVR